MVTPLPATLAALARTRYGPVTFEEGDGGLTARFDGTSALIAPDGGPLLVLASASCADAPDPDVATRIRGALSELAAARPDLCTLTICARGARGGRAVVGGAGRRAGHARRNRALRSPARAGRHRCGRRRAARRRDGSGVPPGGVRGVPRGRRGRTGPPAPSRRRSRVGTRVGRRVGSRVGCRVARPDPSCTHAPVPTPPAPTTHRAPIPAPTAPHCTGPAPTICVANQPAQVLGGGSDHAAIGVLHPGATYQVLGTAQGWVHVRGEGLEGWAPATAVQPAG